MKPLVIALIAAFSVLATLAIVFLFTRKAKKPCYRCGILAVTDFMGVPYCTICRLVVARMLPVVRHDPPFGFPGATGYLDWPEKKKEEEVHG